MDLISIHAFFYAFIPGTLSIICTFASTIYFINKF